VGELREREHQALAVAAVHVLSAVARMGSYRPAS